MNELHRRCPQRPSCHRSAHCYGYPRRCAAISALAPLSYYNNLNARVHKARARYSHPRDCHYCSPRVDNFTTGMTRQRAQSFRRLCRCFCNLYPENCSEHCAGAKVLPLDLELLATPRRRYAPAQDFIVPATMHRRRRREICVARRQSIHELVQRTNCRNYDCANANRLLFCKGKTNPRLAKKKIDIDVAARINLRQARVLCQSFSKG